jgi:hypothetical protein
LIDSSVVSVGVITVSDKSKKANFWFPAITDLKSAQDAARQGTATCALIMTFSTVLVVVATATGSGGLSQLFIVMMLIYGLIAFLIYKMSRVAAIFGLLLYLGDRIVLIAQSGLSGNFVLTIFFVLAFINSIRGTFAYHRFRRLRAEDIHNSSSL